MKFEFSRHILEKYSQYQISLKSVQKAAEFSYADRRTDMTKQTVAFRNFANALKNVYCKS